MSSANHVWSRPATQDDVGCHLAAPVLGMVNLCFPLRLLPRLDRYRDRGAFGAGRGLW